MSSEAFLRDDCALASVVSAENICVCCRAVLTHNEYMTTYLQRERACVLHIKKVAQYVDNSENLVRHILLNDEKGYTHIVSKICISLRPFNAAQQAQLLKSDQPFGTVLVDLGIKPTFTGRRFFQSSHLRWEQNGLAYRAYPRCACGQDGHQHYFGRAHQMLDQQGQRLAEVCEWVP